jgi:hypothetical protein
MSPLLEMVIPRQAISYRWEPLVDRLDAEDAAEAAELLEPDSRLTCHVHRKWIHQCVSSPLHAHPVTRHRWCRTCDTALTVAVDEFARTVSIRCPRCGDGGSPATTRLLAACRASLLAQAK